MFLVKKEKFESGGNAALGEAERRLCELHRGVERQPSYLLTLIEKDKC